MTPRPTDPDIAVMVPASLARIIASGNAGSRDLDALETCVQCAIDSDAVTVQLTRADADTLGEQIGRAIERLMERMDHYGPQDGEHQEMQSDRDALERLSDTIAAAAHQTTEDSL